MQISAGMDSGILTVDNLLVLTTAVAFCVSLTPPNAPVPQEQMLQKTFFERTIVLRVFLHKVCGYISVPFARKPANQLTTNHCGRSYYALSHPCTSQPQSPDTPAAAAAAPGTTLQ